MVVGEDSEVNLSSIHSPSGAIEPWDPPQVFTDALFFIMIKSSSGVRRVVPVFCDFQGVQTSSNYDFISIGTNIGQK